MMLLLQVIGASVLIYGVFYALGYGWARLLLPDLPAASYAPCLGLIQTGFVLIWFGFFDWGTLRSFPFALTPGVALTVLQLVRERGLQLDRSQMLSAVFVALLATALSFPFLYRSGWSSFTIGNNDIYDYVSTARHLQEGGLRPYLTAFGQNPEWADPSLHERAAAWQIPSTRWLSYYDLSFLASFLRIDPVLLYSLYLNFLYAAFLPLLWLLARQTLDASGKGRWVAGTLIVFNPHIYYVLFNAFMPQIAATGFFVAFLTLLPRFARDAWSWRTASGAGLFAAGVLASYIEMSPFLALASATYFLLLFVSNEVTVGCAAARLGLVALCCAALCPYHVFRFAGIVFYHAAGQGGGWPVTDRYYLLPFQLGIFFLRRHPVSAVEWLLNPVLFCLIALGLSRLREWKMYTALVMPLVVAGWISYSNDWNYRYFKNFTYIYYVAPLLLGAGVDAIARWRETGSGPRMVRSAVSLGIGALLSAMVMTAMARTLRTVTSSVMHASRIPVRYSALQTVDAAPALKLVYVDGLSLWDSLWAGYYLGHKSVVMRDKNEYLRNDHQALTATRADRLIVPKGFDVSQYPTAARARIGPGPEQVDGFWVYSLASAR